MLHFNNKLLFLLLLLSGTSLAPDKDQDKTPEKYSPDEHILDLAQDACGTLVGCGVLKTFENILPTEKIVVAEILKMYITHNTQYREFTRETIAQCIVSPFVKYEKKSKWKEDKNTYEYQLLDPRSIPQTLLHSIPKTIVREGILNRLTKFLHIATEKLGIKHPPVITKNKKLHLATKLIVNSLARQVIDEKLLPFLWEKTPWG